MKSKQQKLNIVLLLLAIAIFLSCFDYANALVIGGKTDEYYTGDIDEFAVWNTTLTETDALNMYKRGILDLNISVRSCNDSECDTEAWSSAYTDTTAALNLDVNRYFQFKAELSSMDSDYSPELLNASINYDTGKGIIPTSNANPFWTNESNPQEITLTENQSSLVTWWVNATGTIGKMYKFFAFVDGTSLDATASAQSSDENITITDNIAPTIEFTNPTLDSNQTIDNTYLEINVSATDSESGLKNITIYLYNSTDLLYSNTSTSSPYFINYTDLGDDTYYFNATAYDNNDNSNSTETRNITIEAVQVILNSPANGDVGVIDRTPELKWYNITDGSSRTYHLQVSNTSEFTDLIINQSGISEGADNITGYNITEALELYTPYYWRVRVMYDSKTSIWSDVWNFSATKYMEITLPSNTINFGLLAPHEESNTTETNTIIVQNDGNFITNITLYATDIFDTESNPTSFYQFAISENESNSYTTAQETFINMTNASSTTYITGLDWNDDNDTARIELKVIVPESEPVGYKESTITIVGDS